MFIVSLPSVQNNPLQGCGGRSAALQEGLAKTQSSTAICLSARVRPGRLAFPRTEPGRGPVAATLSSLWKPLICSPFLDVVVLGTWEHCINGNRKSVISFGIVTPHDALELHLRCRTHPRSMA